MERENAENIMSPEEALEKDIFDKVYGRKEYNLEEGVELLKRGY